MNSISNNPTWIQSQPQGGPGTSMNSAFPMQQPQAGTMMPTQLSGTSATGTAFGPSSTGFPAMGSQDIASMAKQGEMGLQQNSGLEGILNSLISQVIAPVVQVLTQLLQSLAARFGLSPETATPQGPPQGGAAGAEQPGQGAAPSAPGTPNPQSPSAGTPSTGAPSIGGSAPTAPQGSSGSEPNAPGTKPSPDAKFFQYKPFSEKDKNIAILLPARLTGESARVEIVSADGEKVITRGKYSGTDKSSNREVFRFDKQGTDIPDGATARITLQNGEVKRVRLDDASEGFKRALK